MYCSEKCRFEALLQYHRIECLIMNLTASNKVRLNVYELMTLRIFLIATKHGSLLPTFSHHVIFGNPARSKKTFNTGIKYDPYDSFNIHNLEDHYDKISTKKWISYAKSAALILHCMKVIGFFEVLQDRPDQVRFNRFIFLFYFSFLK